MRHRSQIAVRIAVAAALAFGLVSMRDGRAGAVAPDLTMTGVNPSQMELLSWALERFAAGGLALPPVDVVAHDSTAPCSGRDGVHVHAAGRSTIHLCTRDVGPVQEFLYLHELAHAWDHHSLTDGRRQVFLETRGLADWTSDDPDRWGDLGAEHAAEVIMWGLMDRPVAVVRLDRNSCAELRAGYVTLVGRAPPHGYTDLCPA